MDATLSAALPLLAWTLCIGAGLLATFLGALLAYHWFRYAMNPTVSMLAFVLYSIIVAILLLGLCIATLNI